MSIQTDVAPNVIDESMPGYESRWKAMVFIAMSLLVIALDNTILNVALPSISKELGASASELQWIIDSYVLVFASLLLTMGSLGDRIGRKRSLQIGLLVFGMGSLGCALTNTIPVLIITRAVTGVGAALIMPATLSIINANFPPNERPRAIAIWAAIFGLAVGVGPLTGGVLLRFFGWQSVFLINLPVAAIAMLGGRLFIAESRDEHAPGFDLLGVFLSILGLFVLVYGIILAGELGWAEPQVFGTLAVGVLLLIIFTIWEGRTPNAMLPLRFFGNPSFTLANIALALMTFTLFAVIFILTQYFQSVLNYTPLLAGIVQLPVAIVVMVTSVRSAKIVERIGTKRTVTRGAFLAGLALLYTGLTAGLGTPYWVIFIGQVTMAGGIGLMISPATNSVMQSVPVRMSGIGSAMNDMTRQVGGALGVAVLGSVLNAIYRSRIQHSLASFHRVPVVLYEMILRSIQGAHIAASQLLPPESFMVIETARIAFATGMRQALLLAAMIMFTVSVLTYLFLPDQIRRTLEIE